MNLTKLQVQLAIDEKRSKRIYPDTKGKITGGIGRNLTDRGFSDDEIDLMFKNDIAFVERELDLNLPWWRQMNDPRQNVLANMCFNIGMPKLLGFKNTLAAMKAGRYEDAATGMLDSLWASQVHDRAKRLAESMKTGEFL